MIHFFKNHVYPILVGMLIATALGQSNLFATYVGDATKANQTTILSRIGTATDAADMDTTVLAGLQYLWDNRASLGASSKPGAWTCTIRTASGTSGDATASCSGNEKVINGTCSGACSRPGGFAGSGQGWTAWCGSGCSNFTVYANCCQ